MYFGDSNYIPVVLIDINPAQFQVATLISNPEIYLLQKS